MTVNMSIVVDAGDQATFDTLYSDLKQRAHALLHGSGNRTLDTTSLVHEAFIKLTEAQARPANRNHLFRLASLAMRQLLIDHLRERQTSKRGGGQQRIDLTGLDLPQDDPAIGLSIVVEALDRLRSLDPRMADVFSLRAFGGMSFEELGEMLGISRTTAQRDFEAARAYLLSTVDG
jgi:RNA polymerase sigma factor (TIGR02999 family)